MAREREQTSEGTAPSPPVEPEVVDVHPQTVSSPPRSSSPDSGTAERAVTVRRPADALAEFGLEDVGLERARKLANQIGGLIREKSLSVEIQRREHIKVEGWCALGALVGVTPKTETVDEVRNPQTGAIEGYTATVVAVRVETGAEIGRATAGCFFDEEQRTRDGDLRQRWLSDTGKPIRHAVMSMAQTRATSKCLGQVLRFIPVMAGFSGTPFEEMDGFTASGGGDRREGNGRRPAPRDGGRRRPSEAPKAGPNDPITQPQQHRLWRKARDRETAIGDESIPASAIVKYVFSRHNVESTSAVTRGIYDQICAEIDAFEPGPPPDQPDPPEGPFD